ncbi:MAG: hypothetical protein V4535_07230 [Bacteroidota bacterium]
MINNNSTDNGSFIKRNPWIIIPILLIIGFIFFNDLEEFLYQKKQQTVWQENDTTEMVKNCILETKELGKKYPEMTKEYCDCSVTQFQAKFSKQEYNKMIKLSIEKQLEIAMPVIESCLKEYQNQIKSQESK